MSFGLGIGDLATALKIANELRKRFVDAPSQYSNITKDVEYLSMTMQYIKDTLPHRDISDQRKQELEAISRGCVDVLKELAVVLKESEDIIKKCMVWKRLRWNEADIDAFRKRLTLIVTGFNMFLQTITNEKIFEIKSTVDDLTKHEDERNCREERREDQGKRQSLLYWLSQIDHRYQQNDEWLGQPGKTMLCSGFPGAGKTIIAATVIDHLREQFGTDGGVGIAYVYFSYQPKQEQQIGDVIGSLVKQLVQTLETVPADIHSLYSRLEQGKRRPSTTDLLNALQCIIQISSRVFIVLDALDEYHASTPAGVNSLLASLFDLHTKRRFNLLATSRPITAITSKFEGCMSKDIRANEDDVRSYVNSRMPELLQSRIHKYPDLQKFLLARLHMDSLQGEPTKYDLKKALARLSEGIDEEYDKAMKRINAQKEGVRKLATKILVWVIYSKVALSTSDWS
ncbi:hypothetical protein K505DRAFT_355332 [Melanomma pulvis-pyrius CBS 109.77]|uniref:NACHT domain-containing protein n=1 Tax=Melanomma pulvis-pyrius CBS 109.77 TaxID=1314802 RepID=A0A6A6XZB7_9PLEO|nr:hypothetical protein K505DRAFT_355332 [Melanomma pulvis-pyrius CBS 109.77]